MSDRNEEPPTPPSKRQSKVARLVRPKRPRPLSQRRLSLLKELHGLLESPMAWWTSEATISVDEQAGTVTLTWPLYEFNQNVYNVNEACANQCVYAPMYPPCREAKHE